MADVPIGKTDTDISVSVLHLFFLWRVSVKNMYIIYYVILSESYLFFLSTRIIHVRHSASQLTDVDERERAGLSGSWLIYQQRADGKLRRISHGH